MKRREFIVKSAAITFIGSSFGLLVNKVTGSGGRNYFRPPGALNEESFRTECIGCDKCVQACPYNSLKSGGITDGMNMGTPYFEFRDKPCYLCEDMPCIKACPTNALDKNLDSIYSARIGTAVITDRKNCLSLNGLRCEICYRVCPLIDKAISLKKSLNKETGKHTIFEPIIHSEYCTGCGICEHSCPLDQTAIEVLPYKNIDKSAHYKTIDESKG